MQGKREQEQMNTSRNRFIVKLMKFKLQGSSNAWALGGVLAICSSNFYDFFYKSSSSPL